MATQGNLRVYSEIGKLKTVLLHRPGKEIENLTPDLMDRLLFDDIPYLEVARKEHDAFADILKGTGAEVLYLEDLTAEALVDSEVRRAFIEDFIAEAGIQSEKKRRLVQEYLTSFSSQREMVDKMIEGIPKEELPEYKATTLADQIESDYPFIVDPMPNLYFTRDPFASVGTGITLHHMRTVTRCRETLFSKYVFDHHPRFANTGIKLWYDRNEEFSIEGGDVLVLSPKVLAIGVSQRTDAAAIDIVANRLFSDGQSFEVILAFDIPKKRAFMHLDTVFTMVDRDKFTIHPEIEGPLTVYSIRRGDRPGAVTIEKETMELESILNKYLEIDNVQLIRCGGGNPIHAAREQWNDGSNTLAIAPGEVVVYSRNHVTNRLLEDAGIRLHIMPSSELSRGRGGPRCMSMPLLRDDL